MKCAGKNRQGEPCKKNAMNGRRHCKTHGGGRAIGVAHHNFKHGKFSRYSAIAGRQIATRYREALSDPELTHHRRDVAIFEARANELLAACESELLWSKTQAAFERLSAAMRSKDDVAVSEALTRLHDLVMRGHHDSIRWAEIYDVVEAAGKAKERENKRLMTMGQMVSVEYAMEQMLMFVNVIVDVGTRTIRDRTVLKEFVNELNAGISSTGIMCDQGDSSDLSEDGAEPRALSLIGMKRYRGQ